MDEALNTEGSGAGESFAAARSADGSTASVADANPVDAPAEVAEQETAPEPTPETAPETQQDAPGATDVPETTETTPETETTSQEPAENAGEGTPTQSA